MPTHAVHVKLQSDLPRDELVRRMKERAPLFRAIEGLEQKYYLAGPEDGWYGGFYLWRSLEDAAGYRQSELAATIAQAYEGIGQPEISVYEIIMPLRD